MFQTNCGIFLVKRKTCDLLTFLDLQFTFTSSSLLNWIQYNLINVHVWS